MPKFTIEDHEKRMRQILTQVEPVERTGVLDSMLEKIRVRRGTRLPSPKPPKLPRI